MWSLPASAAPANVDACAPQQGFYLRRDKLDISVYNNSIDASAAEGAAISYTGDRENGTDTAEIRALAAWVFARNPCSPIGEPPIGRPYVSGYAFAASVLGDGTLTADRTARRARSRLASTHRSKSPTGLSSRCNTSRPRPITKPISVARHRPTAFPHPGNLTISVGGSVEASGACHGHSTSSIR
jgi:hypothetical protein